MISMLTHRTRLPRAAICNRRFDGNLHRAAIRAAFRGAIVVEQLIAPFGKDGSIGKTECTLNLDATAPRKLPVVVGITAAVGVARNDDLRSRFDAGFDLAEELPMDWRQLCFVEVKDNQREAVNPFVVALLEALLADGQLLHIECKRFIECLPSAIADSVGDLNGTVELGIRRLCNIPAIWLERCGISAQ